MREREGCAITGSPKSRTLPSTALLLMNPFTNLFCCLCRRPVLHVFQLSPNGFPNVQLNDFGKVLGRPSESGQQSRGVRVVDVDSPFPSRSRRPCGSAGGARNGSDSAIVSSICTHESAIVKYTSVPSHTTAMVEEYFVDQMRRSATMCANVDVILQTSVEQSSEASVGEMRSERAVHGQPHNGNVLVVGSTKPSKHTLLEHETSFTCHLFSSSETVSGDTKCSLHESHPPHRSERYCIGRPIAESNAPFARAER